MKDMKLFSASLALAAGYCLAAYLPAFYFPLLGCVALAALWWLPRHWQKRVLWLTAVCLLAVVYFLCYDHSRQSFLLPAAKAKQELLLTGSIHSLPQRDGDQVRFELMIPAGQAGVETKRGWFAPSAERISMRVTLSEEAQIAQVASWRPNDRITGMISLALPEAARNPHAFDYARYLRWQGIHVTGQAAFSSIQVEAGQRGWLHLFQEAQAASAKKLEQLYAAPETAGYMKSLLLGLQSEVSPQLQNVYANLGTLHVLAISGLHVTVVSVSFLWLAEKLGTSRRAGVILTFCLIASYVLWVGASASAMRAGIMGGVGLWSLVSKNRIEAREIWALALMAMLICDPYQLWQIGFQLSFAVTLGLIELVPLLMMLPYPRAAWLRSSLAMQVAAQLVSFPFVIYWFHLFNPLSAPVNLVAVPVLSLVVLPLGYASLLLGSLHPGFAALAVYMNEAILGWIHQLFFWLDHWQPPFRHWPHPPWWWLILYYVGLILFTFLWKIGYHRRGDCLVYILCLLALLALARQPFQATEEVIITFLDVGQGESIIVEVGKKTVYLIDGGGTLRFTEPEAWRKRRDPYEVGKDTLLPYLRSRGIEHIDRLVLTHGDQDHVGGIPAILPYFSFGAVLVNHDAPQGVQQQIVQSLQSRHVPILTGKPGDRWEDLPGVEWTWLHPDRDDGFSNNDASIVLLLSAYGRQILFTGDLEQDGERKLLEQVLPPIDVLKVAHHGSKTSTTDSFVKQIQPQLAVISAGRQNRYGHPSEEVLRRLADAHVYRTDQHGAITLQISRSNLIPKTQMKGPEAMQPFKKE